MSGFGRIYADRIFSEENMYRRLEELSAAEDLPLTARALVFARDAHAGQYRKRLTAAQEKVPYIIHPLMMACHAHAMGLRDDALLAVVLLHDVCEDCGIAPESLPFPESVRGPVALLTHEHREGERRRDMLRRYYAELSADPVAAIVKAIDRCNNVSMMAGGFPRGRMLEYVEETEEYVLPLLRHIKYEDPAHADAAFLINYQLRSLLGTVRSLLEGDGTAAAPAEDSGAERTGCAAEAGKP